MKFQIGLLLLAFHCCSASCFAQLSVDRMLFSLPFDSKPAFTVNVTNTDEASTMRIQAESLKILSAKTSDSDDSGTSEGALVVSPREFTLPPGESRAVRLLRRAADPSKEEVFRVNFIPLADDKAVPENKSGKKPAVNLRVLFGVGLLIFTEPKEIDWKLKWSTENGQLTLLNSGNVNYVIDQIEICVTAESCEGRSETSRIYPGGSMSVPWNGSGVVKLRLSGVEKSKLLTLETQQGEQ